MTSSAAAAIGDRLRRPRRRAAGPDARDRKREQRGDAEREPRLVPDRVRREHGEQRPEHQDVGRDPVAAAPREAHRAERPDQEEHERELERRERRGLPLGDRREGRVAEDARVVGRDGRAVRRHEERPDGQDRHREVARGEAPGARSGARQSPPAQAGDADRDPEEGRAVHVRPDDEHGQHEQRPRPRAASATRRGGSTAGARRAGRRSSARASRRRAGTGRGRPRARRRPRSAPPRAAQAARRGGRTRAAKATALAAPTAAFPPARQSS